GAAAGGPPAVRLGALEPDDGRRGGVVRDAGRRDLRRAQGPHRVRRTARHRADHPPEAPRGLPAVRVSPRARHHRRDRPPEGASRAAGAHARLVRGAQGCYERYMISYEDVLGRLAGAVRFGMDLGLERMEAACARLGHPERRLGRVIHVAGTNGKGSTAAMAAAILEAAGLRTGLFTSPHLARVTERIRIAGVELDRAAFADSYERAVGPGLTFFEQLTIVGLLAMSEARVDATVLEVGLGGRLDATNVVDAEVAAVTGVALDHQEVL